MSARVTLVTGAGRGIGRQIALAFARAGDDLVLASRSEEDLKETAGEIGELGRTALVVPTDIGVPVQVDELARAALEALGRVDVVVNNSGIGGPSGPLWELEPEAWEETFAVNVQGVFLVTRAFLPQMIERRAGSVIVIGSITGKRPLWGRTPYAASKMALVGLVRTLALELGPHGIRANLISPGFVEGERIRWVMERQAEGRRIPLEEVRAEMEAEAALGQLTPPQAVADACVFLASEAAASITGVDLNVNSGAVMY